MNSNTSKKLVKSVRAVAEELRNPKFNLNSIGRSYVFYDNGKPCCVIGLAIEKSGFKQKLAPFRGESFDGSIGAVWWCSASAIEKLLGVDLDEDVKSILEEIEAINDVKTGEPRRRGLANSLEILAATLEQYPCST